MGDDVLDPEQVAARRDIALACQKAENEFVGVRCGVMDQMASVIGRAGHAIFLDCSNLHHELVPMFFEEMGVAMVVYDTGIRRGLGESRYNDRRGEAVFHPLPALSIGCVIVRPNVFASHHEVSAALSESKQQAKRIINPRLVKW